jgi:hypothetical protein
MKEEYFRTIGAEYSELMKKTKTTQEKFVDVIIKAEIPKCVDIFLDPTNQQNTKICELDLDTNMKTLKISLFCICRSEGPIFVFL